nr:MAG TPA: hypothetical protein [Caudoviricetes sp.]
MQGRPAAVSTSYKGGDSQMDLISLVCLLLIYYIIKEFNDNKKK